MSFYTHGWFGPYCPRIETGFLASFNVHDFNNPAPAPQPIGGRVNFPLDVAMKLCWEVDEYIINSTVSGPEANGPQIRTSNLNLNISWGEVSDFSNFFTERPSLEKAVEMLCVLGKDSTIDREWTTLLRENYYTFAMPNRPYFYDNLLSYPIGWSHALPENGAIEIGTLVPEPLSGANVREFFQLSTPWGSFTLPYARRNIINSSSSLSITVTAADPQERYA